MSYTRTPKAIKYNGNRYERVAVSEKDYMVFTAGRGYTLKDFLSDIRFGVPQYIYADKEIDPKFYICSAVPLDFDEIENIFESYFLL